MIRCLRGDTLVPPPIWFMRQAGRYLPEYREIRKKAGDFLTLCYTPDYAIEVTLQPMRRFDLDAAILFADILLIPDALGRGLHFVEGRGPVLDPLSPADPLPGFDAKGFHDHLGPVYDSVAGIRGALRSDKPLIGFAGAPWTVATYMIEGGTSKDHAESISWVRQHEEKLGALIDLLVEASILYLGRQIEAGADIIQLFDSWAGALDEESIRKYCMAPTRRIVEAVKAEKPGIPVIGFPRGIGDLYPDYVRETGVDGISIDESIPARIAAETLQPLATVQGNLSPGCLVEGGEAMKEDAARLIDRLAGGPYIFNLGHGIVPQTPPEHVAALVDFVRQYRP